MSEVWGLVSKANQAIVQFSPWVVARQADKRRELEWFLYRQLEDVRLIALLLQPVMPGAGRRIQAMLGLGEREATPEELRWGVLDPGAPLGKIEALFPRIETKEKEKTVSDDKPAAAGRPEAAAPAAGDRIDIADFAKLDLRVAEIVSAEKVPGSKKLIKLQVDLGGERRQLVAGIADSYAPQGLVGKKVAVVVNLKPAKLMGVESNGMILAAAPDSGPVLVTLDSDVAPGTRIK